MSFLSVVGLIWHAYFLEHPNFFQDVNQAAGGQQVPVFRSLLLMTSFLGTSQSFFVLPNKGAPAVGAEPDLTPAAD